MSEYSPPQVNRKLEVNLWWITAVLIAMNVGLYGWQVLSGVDATSPTTA
ncbi:MAG TPA: rhomboid family intramembrane serine protease, partial [Acinetobacter ursingii]|nr:rhomboid family intramembrane serine protease [Acinetobacter ursingii]